MHLEFVHSSNLVNFLGFQMSGNPASFCQEFIHLAYKFQSSLIAGIHSIYLLPLASMNSAEVMVPTPLVMLLLWIIWGYEPVLIV